MSAADFIDKLCQEATPGPWKLSRGRVLTNVGEAYAAGPIRAGREANAELCSAASVLLPHMADLVRALEKYGSHSAQCAQYRHDWRVRFRTAEPTCLCGYSAALASVERAAQQLDTGRDA